MSENALQKEVLGETTEIKMTEESKVEITEQEKKRLKNLKKKQKQKLKKEDKQEEEKKEEVEEQAPVTTGKGKKKKGGKGLGGNIAAKLAAEQLKRKQEEEERIRKEIEEFELQEAERIRLIEEEEQKKKDILEKKKAEKKARKEELKKLGMWKSKKQKQQERIDEERKKLFDQTNEDNEEMKEEEEMVKEKKPKKKFVKPKEELTEKDIQELLEQKEKLRIEQLQKEVLDQETKEEDMKLIDFQKELEDEERKMAEDGNEDDASPPPPPDCDLFNQSNNQSEAPLTKEQGATDEKLELPSLRSPIVCILGHVDTGKTTILDVIRRTNVQEGEAGGITQQIGATFFPRTKIDEEMDKIQSFYPVRLDVPGLLIIDTPGHESFSNLRSRGSSLCDIAILVIDLMHGIEKQTLESIELLKMKKTPFVIALNKIDRLYEWKANNNTPSFTSLESQKKNVQGEFHKRLGKVITQLAENGFNSALYYENNDIKHQVSLIPTSGVTGEGMSDLFGVILKYTSTFLDKKIRLHPDVFACTVLEVKMIQGLGTTIDVILVDGILRENDKIMLMGFDGPIITHIRALLTPHPMKEMRVKGEYIHHKILGASMGIKISGNDLEQAVAGSQLYVITDDSQIQGYSNELNKDLKNIKNKIKLTSQGICVAASTLGSLEAMLNYLKEAKIPVAYVRVGPVSKDDVIKALKPILMEDINKQKREYASVLAFDVKILGDAQEFADKNGITIFTGNIIYNLFDKYIAYVEQVKADRKNEKRKEAVFPCVIKAVQFFNTKDPIIMGVDIEKGQLRIDTPICVYDSTKVVLGSIESIQVNHKPLQIARKEHGSVAIKIKGDPAVTAGRHFDLKSKFCSILSRDSLDILKEYFRDEMEKFDWDVARELKPFFQII